MYCSEHVRKECHIGVGFFGFEVLLFVLCGLLYDDDVNGMMKHVMKHV